MSAVLRTVSLTAIVALIGVAAASEIKGPVHISSDGVTDFGGDTKRFQDAMNADERGEIKFAVDTRVIVRHTADSDRAHARAAADEARRAARVAADEARRNARAMAEEARHAAREAAEAGREAAENAAREVREAMRDAQREARVAMAKARAEADSAMRDARARLADARRDIAERAREMNERSEGGDRFDNAVEIRDGKVVRCNDPSKFPGTGCTPFTPEEKARIEAETHAAAELSRAALAQAAAALEAADRALREETSP
jgi:hypothetical protein